MADAFADLIDRSVAFFTELRGNNTKEFYEPRKAFYTAEIKKPAELLAEVLGDEIARRTGRSLTPKLFRIHRDVRFSKDKTPYNTHLHLMWSATGETAPAWFFGASPDYMVVGTGVMALKGEALTRYRSLVDRKGDAIARAIAQAGTDIGAEVSDWGPEPLKRVPSPYDQDHPHGALLRRKALAVTAPPAKTWRDGLVPAITETVDGMLPFWRILNAEFGEKA